MAMVPPVVWGSLAGAALSAGASYALRQKPPTAPAPPNPDVAANAAQQNADQLRARRGLLANIYAGGQGAQAVSGKTQLGT
jgi:hypothetical protein